MRLFRCSHLGPPLGVLGLLLVLLTSALVDASARFDSYGPRGPPRRGWLRRELPEDGESPVLASTDQSAAIPVEEEVPTEASSETPPIETESDNPLEEQISVQPSPPTNNQQPQLTRNCTKCLVLLVKNYPGVCQLVWRIEKIQILVPTVDEIVKRRMGGRRFSLQYAVGQGYNIIDQLFAIAGRLGEGINKFFKFFGRASNQEIDPDWLPFIESMFSKAEADLSQQRRNLEGVKMDESLELALGRQADERRRRGLLTCARNIAKTGVNTCSILGKMADLDEVLRRQVMAVGTTEAPKRSTELAIKLRFDNLTLVSILEALRASLFGRGPKVLQVRREPRERLVCRGLGIIREKSNAKGRRYLVNEAEEEVGEIFETPDFRMEFVAEEEKGVKNETEVEKRRSMYRGPHRSQAPEDLNAKRRGYQSFRRAGDNGANLRASRRSGRVPRKADYGRG